jgi:hypothetical protein
LYSEEYFILAAAQKFWVHCAASTTFRESSLRFRTILAKKQSTGTFQLHTSDIINILEMATSLEGSYDSLAPFDWPAARKPLQTWYRVFGDLSSSVTPLVCIHGGPGFCHNYLLNHRALTDTHSIPVIFYDQIGSGLSTRLPETASTTDFPDFWTVEIFHEQL